MSEPDRFDCHECGVGVKVDEDGCCATCGRDAIEVAGGLPVGPLRDVYLASPAAAPAAETCPEPPPGLVETLEKVHGMGCGNIATQRILPPPSAPAAPAPDPFAGHSDAEVDAALDEVRGKKPAAPAHDLRRVVERAQVELNRRDARIAELETALVKIRDGCGYGLGNDIPWVRAVAKSALAAHAAPPAKGEGT